MTEWRLGRMLVADNREPVTSRISTMPVFAAVTAGLSAATRHYAGFVLHHDPLEHAGRNPGERGGMLAEGPAQTGRTHGNFEASSQATTPLRSRPRSRTSTTSRTLRARAAGVTDGSVTGRSSYTGPAIVGSPRWTGTATPISAAVRSFRFLEATSALTQWAERGCADAETSRERPRWRSAVATSAEFRLGGRSHASRPPNGGRSHQ
jgi:hypothetical protein